jgi:SAM-dependent methyltransferase
MNRGKYEKLILSDQEQAERNSLPPGVGLEPSPFWDFTSRPYDLFKHMVRYFYIAEEFWQNVITHIKEPNIKVLDIGSGYGEMKVFLQQWVRPKGYTLRYTGADIDPLRMARARTYMPQIDIRTIAPLPDGLADVEGIFNTFIVSEVYEHLEPERAPELFDRMAELAVPGAIAIFTIPTPSFGEVREIPMHLNEVTPEQFLPDAVQHGWECLNWYYLRGRVGKHEMKNVPSVLKAVTLPPQFCQQGNHAIYILRKV